MCKGTSRETGVSARHGFEQSGFIRGLSNEFLSEGCPMNVIRGLSNEFLSEGCPMSFSIRDLSNGFPKQKSFVLKTVFHTW